MSPPAPPLLLRVDGTLVVGHFFRTSKFQQLGLFPSCWQVQSLLGPVPTVPDWYRRATALRASCTSKHNKTSSLTGPSQVQGRTGTGAVNKIATCKCTSTAPTPNRSFCFRSGINGEVPLSNLSETCLA